MTLFKLCTNYLVKHITDTHSSVSRSCHYIFVFKIKSKPAKSKFSKLPRDILDAGNMERFYPSR